jgi:hypothetical protein
MDTDLWLFKMKKVLKKDDGDSSPISMYLIPLNYTFKIFKLINFMLHIF